MGQSTTVIPTGGGGAKVQDSIPTNPQKGDFWVDTSGVTPTVKWYDGTKFLDVESRIGKVANESMLPTSDPAQIFFDNSTKTYKRSLPDDLSTASYTGISINTQDGGPSGIAFKPDGTKLFEVGLSGTGGNIYEYDISTEWDISTASYSGTSINTRESDPTGIAFKPDGTKLFEVDSSEDRIYEYNLSTEWDISTASYSGISISTQDAVPTGIEFKPDGTKLFEVGLNGNRIYEYNLSTEWDISTASYSGTSINTEDGTSQGIAFKSDGTKLFEVGSGGDNIYQSRLSTEWDISTASYSGISINTQDGNSKGIAFKPDGTKLFEVGSGGDSIYEYELPKYETF